MQINIVGSILGTTGYDSHCRGFANALYKLNPDIKLDVPLSANWKMSVNDAELKMLKAPIRTPDVTIAIMTPPNWRIALADNTKHFIGFCVWEGDRIPTYWLEYLMDERVDQIWVPSQHTRDAIINTLKLQYYPNFDENEPGTTIFSSGVRVYDGEWDWDKIKIVPHGFDPKVFYRQRKKNVNLSLGKRLETRSKSVEANNKQRRTTEDTDNHADSSPFVFMCNKGWRGGMEDRGGVQFLLKAFANEFKKNENVELLLKLNPAYISPQIARLKMDELKLPKNSAKIKVACVNATPEQIAQLYNSADCYVCPTRAEAFDLGTAEAMACGLPVITTNYGGQIEHMNKYCADFVDYTLKNVKGDIQYEGIKQGVISIPKLQKSLRETLIRGIKTRKKGAYAQKHIKSWTWDHSAQIAMKNLKILK